MTKRTVISMVSLGIILQWLSLFLSYRLTGASLGRGQVLATGGFPFKIFEYPFSSLGNDWPTLSMWGMFVLNLLVWTAFAFVVVNILGKKFDVSYVVYAVSGVSIFCTAVGLLYIVFQFD